MADRHSPLTRPIGVLVGAIPLQSKRVSLPAVVRAIRSTMQLNTRFSMRWKRSDLPFGGPGNLGVGSVGFGGPSRVLSSRVEGPLHWVPLGFHPRKTYGALSAERGPRGTDCGRRDTL